MYPLEVVFLEEVDVSLGGFKINEYILVFVGVLVKQIIYKFGALLGGETVGGTYCGACI